ncbi:putative Roundabout 2 [Daphnia magna]|uniref:Putative Roundabout 2 n=1 Tax=Daphnia magna TaxID=35525 RepID=A0A164R7E8_9CRUS|nr:putative Roundabout 2 [Daphnia magna]
MPQPVQGIAGDSVVLECEPPRGHPEPQIRWKKNGQSLELDLDLGVDSDRIRVEESGNLVITKLAASDQGRYVCVAQNTVGTRETSPVLLTVNVRPGVIRPPQDITALVGSDVNFECGVTGDPTPVVTWRRVDGSPMPANGRTRPVDHNKSGLVSVLRIERISASDSGRYLCNVENSLGSSSAWAQLTVLVPPTWDFGSTAGGNSQPNNSPLPKEARAHAGQTFTLDCPADGSPKPLIFWNREGRAQPYFANAADGDSQSRWSVLSNGTLVIRDVRREDASALWCAAVNEAGSLMARTRLEVISISKPPPVVIEVGPANQTLPTKSPASLPCQAEGQPVKWTKDGRPLNVSLAMDTFNTGGSQGSHHSRISLSDSGLLMIDDLQLSDAGTYTCEVGEDDQFAAWTATLAVASPTNPNVVFYRSPSDPMALPGSPSQPRLLQKTSTSLTIGWQSGSRMGASTLLGYTIEVFNSAEDDYDGESARPRQGSWTWTGPFVQVKRSWRIVTRGLKADQFTLNDLQPATSYTFLVRAENNHGLSLPSPVSPWFTTLPATKHNGQGQWQSAAELEDVRLRLSAPRLRLDQARSINSTSVRLSWQLLDGDSDTTLDAIHVWYRRAEANNDSDDDETLNEEVVIPMNRIMSANHLGSFSHTLGALSPYTRYVFFLVPSFRNVLGQPSNSKMERTMEAVPAGPPLNLVVRQLNATSVLVQWLPPPIALRNGNITSYQISVALDGTNPRTLLANLTIPALPTSVVIGGLNTNTAYSIQAAAWTLMGLGPTSPPVVYRMEPVISSSATNVRSGSSPSLAKPSDDENSMGGSDSAPQGVTQVVQETWFILLLGGILLAILCLLVAALLVRRNLAKKKALSALSKSDPIVDASCHGMVGGVAGTVRGREAFWSRGWSTSIGNAKEMDAQATLLPHGVGTTAIMNRSLVPPPEYAELLGHGANQDQSQHQHPGQLSLSSFLPRRNPNVQQPHPAAYATTTLVAHRNNASNSQQHCVNHDPYAASCSAFSASDSSGYTTDELGDRCRRPYPSGISSKSRQSNGSNGVKPLPNLGELLPPPPRHPPPINPSQGIFDRQNSEALANHLAMKNASLNGPLPVHSSPALSKRNVISNSAANGQGANQARRSSSSPLAGGTSQHSATGSHGSHYTPDHYQTVGGQQYLPEQNDDVSDSESNEYAYAYHNPIENVRSTGMPSVNHDQCNIFYPRHNSYLRPFNSHQNHQGPKHLNTNMSSYDPQQPRSLTSHLLPNGSCFTDRVVQLGNIHSVESPRIPVKNFTNGPDFSYESSHNCHGFSNGQERSQSECHNFEADGDDEDDSGSDDVGCQGEVGCDHNDTESSLYAEADNYDVHLAAHQPRE